MAVAASAPVALRRGMSRSVAPLASLRRGSPSYLLVETNVSDERLRVFPVKRTTACSLKRTNFIFTLYSGNFHL
jgi:hypothetical protein